MNIKLLRRIQKKILKEPRQFLMSWWFKTGYLGKSKIPNCGTAACIGGWACVLSSQSNPNTLFKTGSWSEQAMQEALEIDIYHFNKLCVMTYWPTQFQKHTKGGTPAFARQAVKRIDHFIKTKGAE